MKRVAVIPVYNPEPGLKALCEGLLDAGFETVVVDDGSILDRGRFDELPSAVRILKHEENRGKGRAIKTALANIDGDVVVFCDGDGQHAIDDIIKVTERAEATDKVTLGVRDFFASGVPFRSRLGNIWTNGVMFLVTGFKTSDTQTGLRAIPKRLWKYFVDLEGERFEYEVKLFPLLKGLGETFEEVVIKTIYLEQNRTSHFRPLVDSWKVQKALFKGVKFKSALVTGGAGFIGSHLCRRLLDRGMKVVAVDNLYTGSVDNVKDLLNNPRFKLIKADVTKHVFLPFEKFDEIYNLACPASPVHYQARPLFTTMTSIKGILLCLERAKRDGAKLLHASTSEIYGDPLVHPQEEHYWGNVNTIGIRSCYDEGKRVGETLCHDYVREYDVDVRVVRIFNTYGPNMHPADGRVVSNFIVQALEGKELTIYGDGSQTRSFQYVDDLIDAWMKYMALDKAAVRKFAAEHKQDLPVINTGNPGEFTVKELAEKVIAALGGTIKYEPLPGDDPKKRKPDITLAKELLGWEPKITLDEGLKSTIEYFKKRCAK